MNLKTLQTTIIKKFLLLCLTVLPITQIQKKRRREDYSGFLFQAPWLKN